MTTAANDPKPISVVIADDHAIWRSGVRADLGARFEIVAEAATADEAIAAVRATEPDLVLSDLNMPGGGVAVARAVGADVPVVMLTVSEAERDVLEAVAAGAVGYLVKSTTSDDLRSALERAANGEPVFSPSLAALVLAEFRALKQATPDAVALTDREREVLGQVAKGLTYKAIGEALFISPKTVENHVRNILDKLHLTRKSELMRYAVEHDIE